MGPAGAGAVGSEPVCMCRLVPLLLVLLALGFGPSQAGTDLCAPRLLVLSAYPAEIDKLLTSTTVTDIEVIDGRRFFVGSLRGNEVVLALTGIGLVNAEATTRAAIGRFACGSEPAITGIVFSGVAGGRSFIGDVTVPARWTLDDGATSLPVDAEMFAVAEQAIAAGVPLEGVAPLGDVACVGIDPNIVRAIRMPNQPQIRAGGDGKSADPFGGRAFPCIPGGGNVFGCEPCRAPGFAVPDVRGFVSKAAPFADPDFFLGYFESPTPSTTEWDAEDMETAGMALVATEAGIPFIAFRAMSDGEGDPLRLPGFPFQFFIYHQLAANNAATVALAFLEAWANA